MFLLLWYFGSAVVIGATLLSMTRSPKWWVRVWDFPRMQILVLGLLVWLIGIWVWTIHDSISSVWMGCMGLLTLSIIQQGRWAMRMTRWARPEVRTTSVQNDESVVTVHRSNAGWQVDQNDRLKNRIRVIASNVDYTNVDRAAALDALLEHTPDLLALVETDRQWGEALDSELDDASARGSAEKPKKHELKHRHEELRDGGRGMVLLSKHELHDARAEYLVLDDRPSIWATIRIADVLGEVSAETDDSTKLSESDMIGICVLHPPPPGLPKRNEDDRLSSKPRDNELTVAAEIISQSPIEHWLVIGDFNDVGWSRTTEEAKSVGRVLDPRIGRGFFNTFPARLPLLRYPIDHVLVTESFTVSCLSRLKNIGSDHLPLLADLHLEPINTVPDQQG